MINTCKLVFNSRPRLVYHHGKSICISFPHQDYNTYTRIQDISKTPHSHLFPKCKPVHLDYAKKMLTLLQGLHKKEVEFSGDKSSDEVNKEAFLDLLPAIQNAITTHTNTVSHSAKENDNFSAIVECLHDSLGVTIKEIVDICESEPMVFNMNIETFEEKINNFTVIGIKTSDIGNLISKCPKLLLITVHRMHQVINFLLDQQFTTQEITKLLLTSPNVFVEPFSVTEEKMYYIMHHMNDPKNHEEIANKEILKQDLKYLRLRHQFLKRRGFYQQPDKSGVTHFVNPSLEKIFMFRDKKFCSKVAMCTIQEYNLFKEIHQLELYHEEKNIQESLNDDLGNEEESETSSFTNELLRHL